MACCSVPYICPRAVSALKDPRIPRMNSTMEDLRQSLSRTFNIERNGGSILVRDDSTLMLLNYNLVHLQLIDAVKTQHPDVEIYFENYAHSSSGYVVFFLFKSKRRLLTSSEFFQFLLLSVLATVVYSLVLGAVPFDVT
jgi:hypothetical protein